MKNKTLIIPLLLAHVTLFAQNTAIRGVVYEQNSQKKPLSNVQVTATKANPTDSDGSGLFLLKFTQKLPGNTIAITATRSGYEVVNDLDIKSQIIPNNDQEKIRVIMCKTETLASNRIKYYNISEEEYSKNYRLKIDKLNQQYAKKQLQTQEYDKKMAALEEEYDNALANLDLLADKFARINLDDASEEYKQAVKLFEEGQIDKAISILEKANLYGKLSSVKGELKRIENLGQEVAQRRETLGVQKQQDIDALLFKADLHALKFEVDKEKECYDYGIQIDDTNLKLLNQYNDFFSRQKRYDEAMVVLKNFQKKANNLDENFFCSRKLGGLYSKTNKTDESLTHLREAELAGEKLYPDNPAYIDEMAYTYSRTGLSSLMQGNIKITNIYIDKAEKLYTNIDIAQLQEADLLMLNDIYAIKGIIAMQFQRDQLLFEKNMLKSSEMIQRLVLINPSKYLPDLANNHRKIAAIYVAKLSSTISEQAKDYMNIGTEAYKKKTKQLIQADADSALHYFKKGEAIFQDLKEKNKEAYTGEWAGFNEDISSIYEFIFDIDKQAQYLQKALEGYEYQLTYNQSLANRTKIADMYEKLGDILDSKLDYSGAIINYKKSNTEYTKIISLDKDYEIRSLGNFIKIASINIKLLGNGKHRQAKMLYKNATDAIREAETILQRYKNNPNIQHQEASQETIHMQKIQIDYARERLAVCEQLGITEPQPGTWQANFDEVNSFSGGLAAAKLDLKWGYVNETGQIVIPIQYKFATMFSNNTANVCNEEGCGVIDKDGNILVPLIHKDLKVAEDALNNKTNPQRPPETNHTKTVIPPKTILIDPPVQQNPFSTLPRNVLGINAHILAGLDFDSDFFFSNASFAYERLNKNRNFGLEFGAVVGLDIDAELVLGVLISPTYYFAGNKAIQLGIGGNLSLGTLIDYFPTSYGTVTANGVIGITMFKKAVLKINAGYGIGVDFDYLEAYNVLGLGLGVGIRF